jgi:ribosomal protein L40E
MRKEYVVKQNDYERIIKDFRSIKFSCIRCGSKNIKVMDADSHPDGIKVHGVLPTSPSRDNETMLYVVGILICMKCNHRFHVKIFDQGMRNTNLYFDNSL